MKFFLLLYEKVFGDSDFSFGLHNVYGTKAGTLIHIANFIQEVIKHFECKCQKNDWNKDDGVATSKIMQKQKQNCT